MSLYKDAAAVESCAQTIPCYISKEIVRYSIDLTRFHVRTKLVLALFQNLKGFDITTHCRQNEQSSNSNGQIYWTTILTRTAL